MAEVTNKEEGGEALPEGAIGRIEPDSTNPELKAGQVTIEFVITSDSTIFNNRQAALLHEETLRDRRKGE